MKKIYNRVTKVTEFSQRSIKSFDADLDLGIYTFSRTMHSLLKQAIKGSFKGIVTLIFYDFNVHL